MIVYYVKLVYVVTYVIVTLLSGSLCKECEPSMYYNNDPPVMIRDSYNYCFLNECTIIIVESNASLNIINNTGDWIIATNRTNLFTIFTNGSIQNCSSDINENTSQRPDVVLYSFEIILYFVVFIAATANVSIHFMYKELRTVSGILIIILCISLHILVTVAIVHAFIIYHQVNIQRDICAIIFSYFDFTICGNIYEATKTIILAHFAYTMYRSYRLLGSLENEKILLCKYIAFIIGIPTIIGAMIITIDVTVSRAAFNRPDGECIPFVYISASEGSKPISVILNYVILIIWLFVETLLLTVGLILYFLNTKKCCVTSTSRDFRVLTVLVATVDLNVIVFIIFLFVDFSKVIAILLTAVTAIQQATLLILFTTSSKVKCCSMKGTSSAADLLNK